MIIQSGTIILSSIKPIPAVKVHDILNQKVWDGDKLRPEIREKLMENAKAFHKFLEIDTPYVDILFTGSLANYNYTNKSDIDLHLLYDFSKIDENYYLVDSFMKAKKVVWNDAHDITIKGFDLEFYGQSITEEHITTGAYSILYNKWKIKPIPTKPEIDTNQIRKKAEYLALLISKTLKSKDVTKIQALQDKIKKMRQSGLEKGGEYSVENLVFKALRNSSNMQKLLETKRDIIDKKLSLKSENDTIAVYVSGGTIVLSQKDKKDKELEIEL